MSQQSQSKTQNKDINKKQENQQENQQNNTEASGGYQTPVDEEIRQTGVASKSDGKPTARPESPENDEVVGSPNQGTESR